MGLRGDQAKDGKRYNTVDFRLHLERMMIMAVPRPAPADEEVADDYNNRPAVLVRCVALVKASTRNVT